MINIQSKVTDLFDIYRSKTLQSGSSAVIYKKRKNTKTTGATARIFIRMRHLFKTGDKKPTTSVSLFQRKQEKGFD